MCFNVFQVRLPGHSEKQTGQSTFGLLRSFRFPKDDILDDGCAQITLKNKKKKIGSFDD